MLPRIPLVSLAASFAVLIAASLPAQTRSTVLVGPPALGATCYVRHVLPAGSVGHIAGFLWSSPFAGAVPVPGLAVNGLLRVDPTAFVVLGITLTDGANLPSFALSVPSLPSLLGVCATDDQRRFPAGPQRSFRRPIALRPTAARPDAIVG
jgi:hypothetical protein